LSTLSKAKKDLQQSFGSALGKLMAHEIRHQLAPSSDSLTGGLGHSSAGLGRDGAPFWDPMISFTNYDQGVILANMNRLVKLQGNLSTEVIKRKKPY
jgi:hypothetical protein